MTPGANPIIRRYYWGTRRWPTQYPRDAGDNLQVVDDVTLSLEPADPYRPVEPYGPLGDIFIQWVKLGSQAPDARLHVYHDAWPALASIAADLLPLLLGWSGQGPTVEAFIDAIKALGFVEGE